MPKEILKRCDLLYKYHLVKWQDLVRAKYLKKVLLLKVDQVLHTLIFGQVQWLLKILYIVVAKELLVMAGKLVSRRTVGSA
jgi:hypothetical protein